MNQDCQRNGSRPQSMKKVVAFHYVVRINCSVGGVNLSHDQPSGFRQTGGDLLPTGTGSHGCKYKGNDDDLVRMIWRLSQVMSNLLDLDGFLQFGAFKIPVELFGHHRRFIYVDPVDINTIEEVLRDQLARAAAKVEHLDVGTPLNCFLDCADHLLVCPQQCGSVPLVILG